MELFIFKLCGEARCLLYFLTKNPPASHDSNGGQDSKDCSDCLWLMHVSVVLSIDLQDWR